VNRPSAFSKAESLRSFALSTGAQLDTFVLVLTDAEGLELIDWLVEENPDETLALDAAIAHRTGNPWEVLAHFQLIGLPMIPPLALN
jgi:hypothetical protein